MNTDNEIFDDIWMQRAALVSVEYWAELVCNGKDDSGEKYLDCLRRWYVQLSSDSGPDEHLLRRLENFENEQHVAGVNELAWRAYLQSHGMSANPIPLKQDIKTPDFEVIGS